MSKYLFLILLLSVGAYSLPTTVLAIDLSTCQVVAQTQESGSEEGSQEGEEEEEEPDC